MSAGFWSSSGSLNVIMPAFSIAPALNTWTATMSSLGYGYGMPKYFSSRSSSSAVTFAG